MPSDVPDRMPAPDNRPVKQLWDVHWSIVLQHVQCRERQRQDEK